MSLVVSKHVCGRVVIYSWIAGRLGIVVAATNAAAAAAADDTTVIVAANLFR